MKLGIYRRPSSIADSDIYIQLGLYNFDDQRWHESSDGDVVSKASENPSPEELKVRFDLDPDARWTVVATPDEMEDAGHEVEIGDSDTSVEDGHKARTERGGPLVTQTEREAQRRQGLRVFPDGYALTDASYEFYQNNGETVIRESEWEFDFSEEFDIEF